MLRTLTIVEDDRPVQNVAFCPWCEGLHYHGLAPGMRGAHCTREDSPYRATGYRLDVQGTVPRAIDALPDAPAPKGRCLHQRLDQVSGLLRNAVLRHALGRRFSGAWGVGRFGRAAVQIYADHWIVAPEGLKRGESLGFDRPGTRQVEGHGLIGLFALLYGLPAGVVAVRLLEAVAFVCLDAEARLAVAAAVDAWAERRAARAAGR